MQASEIVRSLKLDEIIRAEGSTCLAEFAETLEKAPDANIETFLSTRPKTDRAQLAALIAIELRHCWERQKPCFIEGYFQRFPELLKDREQVLDLIYAEYCERRQLQEAFESEEYYERFPDLQDSLERLFQIDSLFEGAPDAIEQAAGKTLKLPDAGDEFLDFRLMAELGRGAFGRVFLAEQASLSDRRVVVKITPLRTIEHQTLARLDHPNIVPVHSVHRDELNELQAVCMPYQCAVALSDVYTTWRETGLIPTTADVFVQALQKLVPAELRKSEEPNGDSRFPARQSYVYACGWLMQKLAAALHHAHLRGIYHRDLKPSNILLTTAGQPLLVDFNLAFNQEESGGDSRAFFGGTLPYMPPEQIQVLHPAEQGRADDVGPRSDIYSLAATVFELLTGRLPFDPPKRGEERLVALRGQLEQRYAGVPSARLFNPHVPQDFDALLAKCLAPASYQRYETAAQLAEDLERFLQGRPLKNAGHVPVRQVLFKFVRRNRHRFAAAGAAIGIALTIFGLAQWAYDNHLRAEQERQNREEAQLAAQEAGFKGAQERQEREKAELAAQEAGFKEAQERQEREKAEQVAKFAGLEREKAEGLAKAAEFTLNETNTDIRKKVTERLKDVSDANMKWVVGVVEYYRVGKHRAAIYAFTDAIEAGYRDSQVYFFRGHCHAGFDEDQAALDDYSKAISLKSDFGYAYLNRALTYASSRSRSPILKDLEKARLDVEQALKYAPPDNDSKAAFFFYDAAKVYSAVSDADPKNPDQDLVDKAKACLFKAVELGQSPEWIQDQDRLDRFRLLRPLLNRPDVQKFLEEHRNKDNPTSP